MKYASRKVKTSRASSGEAEGNNKTPTISSHNPSHQIVFLSFRNQNINQFPGNGIEAFGSIVNQNTTVNIRSLRFHSSLPKQFGLIRLAFEDDAHSFADPRLVLPARYPGLRFHQTRATLLREFWIDFVRQVVGGRALFIRISEDSDPIEFDVLYKSEQLFKSRFSPPGKPLNKGRTHGDARHARPNPFDRRSRLARLPPRFI